MSAIEPPLPYATAARELLRNTLLDAATQELAKRPWSEITMSDIAGAAGLSRQTVYNEFGSRAQFAQELVLREARWFVDAAQSTIASNRDDPRQALRATFELFLTVAAENPLVSAIVSRDGGDELIALFTTRGETLVQMAAQQLGETLLASWPAVAADAAASLSECLVRLAISYAALPTAGPPETAEMLASFLGPYVEELVGVTRR